MGTLSIIFFVSAGSRNCCPLNARGKVLCPCYRALLACWIRTRCLPMLGNMALKILLWLAAVFCSHLCDGDVGYQATLRHILALFVTSSGRRETLVLLPWLHKPREAYRCSRTA